MIKIYKFLGDALVGFECDGSLSVFYNLATYSILFQRRTLKTDPTGGVKSHYVIGM